MRVSLIDNVTSGTSSEYVPRLVMADWPAMARYVEDLALLLPVLCGPDRRNPFTFDMSLEDYRKADLKSLRIGWWTGDGRIEPTLETSTTVEGAAKALLSRRVPNAVTFGLRSIF
ncbi:MAG: amidase family protein [Pirellulaceae bacterium]